MELPEKVNSTKSMPEAASEMPTSLMSCAPKELSDSEEVLARMSPSIASKKSLLGPELHCQNELSDLAFKMI